MPAANFQSQLGGGGQASNLLATQTASVTSPATIATVTAVGSAFTNQPSNDGVEILSSSAADTTQTTTIIGTTTGTNTLVSETIALNGTTFVSTVKTNWGVIVAVKLSASCAGTVTWRKATGDATITTAATTVLKVGVNTVTSTNAFNKVVSVVSSGATTKQFGFQGTNSAGAVILDSVPLTGATAALSNSAFQTLSELYTGDVEATRTETVTAGLSGTDYQGTATNDSAQAGKLGEFNSAQLLAASKISLTTTTAANVTSFSLTAGDWEVSAAIHFIPVSTTVIASLIAGVSQTTATQPSVDAVGGWASNGAVYTSGGATMTVTIPETRVSLAATTTVFLVATGTFSVSTCTAYGTIRARRAR